MVFAACREVRDRDSVFVGVGLPNLAVQLALRLHAPRCHLIYESGVFGARPVRLPISIGDPCLVSGAAQVLPMAETFLYFLQGGRTDLGFLGAAQIDRYGNLNTTVVGRDYDNPKVRLPGAGGAPDIALNARRTVIIVRQDLRKFVEKTRLPHHRRLGRRREKSRGDGCAGRRPHPGDHRPRGLWLRRTDAGDDPRIGPSRRDPGAGAGTRRAGISRWPPRLASRRCRTTRCSVCSEKSSIRIGSISRVSSLWQNPRGPVLSVGAGRAMHPA